MPRYADDDYGRDRAPARRDQRDSRESRDRGEPRERVTETRERVPRIDERMDTMTRNPRMDDPMDMSDPRMDRLDPRAATGISRPDQRVVEARREPEVLYRDPRTGELYRDPAPRQTYTRDDRMDRDDISTQRKRPLVETGTPRHEDDDDDSRPGYNNYFLPGDGIEREVIQHEICKFLGQDATCRPYRHQDGRQGYLIRAYRTFTSEMIRSLKEDSSRWQREREKRQRSGRSGGSYAEMQDRQDAQRYNDGMDIDDDYTPPARHRDVDPRVAPGGRHAAIPVTSGFAPEPGYPAQYSLSSNQPGNYGPASEPRSYAGNTTPPATGRPVQPAYAQPGYPPRTAATAPPVPITSYRDPRTGEITTYAPAYPVESTSARRHR